MYREKGKLKKCAQREKKQTEKEKRKAEEIGSPKRHTKNMVRRLRRRKMKEIAELKVKLNFLHKKRRHPSSESEDPKDSEAESNVGSALWNVLFPNAKRKAKVKLKDSDLNRGLKQEFREQLGVNLGNPVRSSLKCSPLKQMVSSFFERDDVTRVCPDRQKVATDPNDPERKVPATYRMAYLKTVHLKFVAECELSCSYETFTCNVPFNVRKPLASDWGICSCAACLNPELKLEKLAKLKKIEGLEENTDDEKFTKLIQNIESLQEIEKAVDTDVEEEIMFPEWQKVANPKSKKKGSKISRRVQSTPKMSRFVKLLVNELDTLKDHLHRVHMQFKAFKDASSGTSYHGSRTKAPWTKPPGHKHPDQNPPDKNPPE